MTCCSKNEASNRSGIVESVRGTELCSLIAGFHFLASDMPATINKTPAFLQQLIGRKQQNNKPGRGADVC
jgi:hypothetical protein